MRLIVYAGANGAGKSTLREIGADPVDVVIDPDRIARSLNPTNPRAVDREAGAAALTLFAGTLRAGRSLSLETTLSGRTVLTRMRMARDAGYTVELRYVGLESADLNVERVKARAAAGGHFIDPDTVMRRAASSLENLPIAAALADIATLVDNSGKRHRRVMTIDGGEITQHVADLPRWVTRVRPLIAAAIAQEREAALVRSLSPDGRLLFAALARKIDGAEPSIGPTERMRLRADTLRSLVARETAEGPIVLSVEQRQAARRDAPSASNTPSESRSNPDPER